MDNHNKSVLYLGSARSARTQARFVYTNFRGPYAQPINYVRIWGKYEVRISTIIGPYLGNRRSARTYARSVYGNFRGPYAKLIMSVFGKNTRSVYGQSQVRIWETKGPQDKSVYSNFRSPYMLNELCPYLGEILGPYMNNLRSVFG